MAEEFYTHELQEKMDVSKWLDSEQAHRDLCGNYEYCAFCNKAEGARGSCRGGSCGSG